MTVTPSPQSVVVPDPLWMMHVIGPDDIYPAPDHATAVQWCAYLNREIAPKVPEVLCVAVPAIWTGTAEEHAEGLAEAIKGWAVPAAPAPSSLAGGEVREIIETLEALTKGPDHDEFDRGARAARLDALDMIRPLAALSPEAPAREGLGWSVCEAEMHLSKLESLQPAVNIGRPDASAALEWARERLAALTPRHEAPASEVDAS